MKILILTEDYPSSKNQYAMSYVHSRNKIYNNHFSISVLNFRAVKDYSYEGIDVITLNSFKSNLINSEYDLLISHAPNVKNHVTFIKKYKSLFKDIIFIIHGHEVLPINKYYPKSYKFKKSIVKDTSRVIYDMYKLNTLSKLFNNLSQNNQGKFIFVSSWMRMNFMKNIKLNNSYVMENSEIIHNAANNVFIENTYKFEREEKLADFISIRPFDQPKYCIDLIVKFAENNPGKTFHIYGEGDYFKYYPAPKNITVINSFIEQKDIPALLNRYTCALMPTRLDSQGVMVCEIVTYGMPCITSDLPICREMLDPFPNVIFISNDDYNRFNSNLVKELTDFNMLTLPEKFHNNQTVNKEITFIKSLV